MCEAEFDGYLDSKILAISPILPIASIVLIKKVTCLKEATIIRSNPIRSWGIILNQFLRFYEKRVRL